MEQISTMRVCLRRNQLFEAMMDAGQHLMVRPQDRKVAVRRCDGTWRCDGTTTNVAVRRRDGCDGATATTTSLHRYSTLATGISKTPPLRPK